MKVKVKDMKAIKKYSYRNGEVFKYKNTRLKLLSLDSEEYGIEFKILSEDLRRRSFHIVEKNKIVITGIRISREAAICLMVGLQEQLKKDGII